MTVVSFTGKPPRELSKAAAERLGITTKGSGKKPHFNIPADFSPSTPHFNTGANADTVKLSPEAMARLLKGKGKF